MNILVVWSDHVMCDMWSHPLSPSSFLWFTSRSMAPAALLSIILVCSPPPILVVMCAAAPNSTYALQ